MGKNKTLYHIIFWAFALFYTFMIYFEEAEKAAPIYKSLGPSLLEIFFYAVVFYTNLYVLIPRILKKLGTLSYIIGVICLMLIVFGLANLSPLFDTVDKNGSFFSSFTFLDTFFYLADLSLFLLISFLYWYVTQHRLEKEKALQLQNEKLHAQLQFLRSQISPHFLFNSLNNIYSLIIQKDDNASLMVEKIAAMLRYIIYEGKDKKVPMHKEVNLIENYIDLQFLKKMKNRELIQYSKAGNFSEKEIVPLLLMHSVESCFKHSNLETNSNGVLQIQLSEANDILTVTTKNTYSAKNSKRKKGSFQSLKQQLKHHYPNKHSIDISDKKGVFIFNMTLELC